MGEDLAISTKQCSLHGATKRKETQRSRDAKHQDEGKHERIQCACAANTETVLVQHQQVDATNGLEAFRG